MRITEHRGTRIALPEAKGDKYKVRLMGWEPGATVVEGSSADYPVEAIKRDFAEAFPKGTRMRANHDGICEAGGDIRRIMAKTVDTPWAEADGMYAHMNVPDEYASFVENFGDVIGLSISAGCELATEAATDENGDPILDHNDKPIMVNKKSERGAVIVERFMTAEESPYNSVDFVEAPGADGRIVARAVESAREVLEHFTIREAATFAKGTRKTEASEAAPPRNNQSKENSMTDEEIQALAEDAANRAVAKALEALKAGEPKPTEHKLSDTVNAVLEAGLSKRGRTAVLEKIEAGGDPETVVAEQRSFEDEIKAEMGSQVPSGATDELAFGYTKGEGAGLPAARDSFSLSEGDRKTLTELERAGEVL
jgi:hypothetical protein